MSAQLLGKKWLRRLTAITGETVVRGWAHGGYIHDFVTEDHRHGSYDLKTGEVAWVWNGMHYTSCYLDFWPEMYRAKQR